jgi:hypothetical protein
MNENNNRVPAAMADTVMTDIMNTIQVLETKLTAYMVGLSPEERIGLPKINVDNKAFVEDAINEMRNPVAAQIIPAFLKPADADADLKMFNQMELVFARMTNLASKVEGTRILAGSEAYTTALSFKRLADAAEAAGIAGAGAIAVKLRERFKGQGSTASNAPDITAPSE